MPETLENRSVRIGVGGDTGSGQHFRRVSEVAMEHDLDFIVIGGDIAYADGGSRDWRGTPQAGEAKRRWVNWFNVVQETMTTDTGRVVPMVMAIGNHEVWGGYYSRHPAYRETDAWRERLAPIFYNIFAFPGQPGYGVLDFGDYLSFVLLDSAHTNPVAGTQTEWLKSVLKQRTHIPHVFPVYHVAAYPSARSFDGGVQSEIREHWHPWFDAYGVEIVFENHDHTYKRTHPIRNGEIAADGIVYIGDGAWGAGGRGDQLLDVDETWYLHKALPDRHCIIVELSTEGRQLRMFNVFGKLIDQFP